MGSKLFVGNISWNANENDLRSAFEPHGEVVECKIVIDRDTNRSRGFGFVKFASDDQAKSAMNALDMTEFMGREMRVSVAEEKPRNNDRGGYNNNRGGERRGGYQNRY